MDDSLIERDIKWSKIFLVGVMAVCVTLYSWKFYDFPKGNPDSWGQFGDFLGGVMNPLIAFGAFYWLTTSVRLQKTELAETRKALQDSHKAQERHATTALMAAQIQAANIRLAAVSNMLNHHRNRRAALLRIIVNTDMINKSVDEKGGMTQLGVQLHSVNREIDRLEEMEAGQLEWIVQFGESLAHLNEEEDPNMSSD